MLDLNRIQKELNITIHPDDVEVFKKLTDNICYCIPIIIYYEDDAIDVELSKLYNTEECLKEMSLYNKAVLKYEFDQDELLPVGAFIIAEYYDSYYIIYDSVSRKLFYLGEDSCSTLIPLVDSLSTYLEFLIYPSVVNLKIDNVSHEVSDMIDSESLYFTILHTIEDEHFCFHSEFELKSPIVDGLLAEDPYGNIVLVNTHIYLLIHDEESKYRSIKLSDNLDEFKEKTKFCLYEYDEEEDNRRSEELRRLHDLEEAQRRADPNFVPECSIHITEFIKQLGKPRADQKYNKSGEYQLTQAYIDGSITKEEFILLGDITETYASLQ